MHKLDKISVIHVVPDLHSSSGGPSRSIVQLTDSLARRKEMLVTVFYQQLLGESIVHSKESRVNNAVFKTNSKLSLKFSILALYSLYKLIKKEKPLIIHSHGIWSLMNHWAAVISRRNKIPFVVHTRGMLLPKAMEYKTIKKNIAMIVFQRLDLKLADILIATSNTERDSLRDLGFIQPIAVIPNGIELSHIENNHNHIETPNEGNERIVLFLSRIHPIKGILNLIKAWANISKDGWKLRIAGPDEAGHLQDVLSLIDELNVSHSVEYIGEVFDNDKSKIFKEADLFILPTLSENFGVVVVEALSYGIPVITTHGAPWSDLEKYNCGWWVESTESALSKALQEAILLEDNERIEMGLRASEYVKIYNWSLIAKSTSDLYLWVIKGDNKPNFVYIV
jgi:glycosyltransferase involved in cell wall biosynthesis